mmetsp:Transcript_19491/g.20896  ORF Transcript_19491/g.20896 Transcript_19491/m.20896 type:complete len:303 (-) Transcript_19491:258-1166(-)
MAGNTNTNKRQEYEISAERSNRWSLQRKNFVVTGGTKGIGKSVVKELLAHGAAGILFCSLSPCNFAEYLISIKLDPTLSYAEGNTDGVPIIKHIVCDVSTSEGREKLHRTTKETFGDKDNDNNVQCVHGLINNVGINVRKTIIEQTSDEYHSILRTNVDAAYFLCKMFSNLFVEGDSTIVNVSSAAGVQSSGTGAAYGMTKAAINQFTRVLACEWAKRKIRVNAVTPWMTMTPMLEEAVANNPSQLDKVQAWTPMGRLASAEEIADPIIFLCLPASSYITGQVLGVDGGLTAQGFNGPCCET